MSSLQVCRLLLRLPKLRPAPKTPEERALEVEVWKSFAPDHARAEGVAWLDRHYPQLFLDKYFSQAYGANEVLVLF